MSSNIIFNKTNITNQNNNRLRYNFPRSIQFKQGDTIALSHLSMFYSWFNITQAHNNNKFFYKWWDTSGNLTIVEEVVIEDGYYSVSSLYEYLQRYMVSKGHYLETLDGNYMYFIEILTNSTYYAVNFRLNSVSEQVDYGNGLEPIENYVKLPTTWKIPTTFQTPEIIIPSTNYFGNLLGFKPQTIQKDLTIAPVPTTQQKYDFFNDITPTMEPSSSFIITCNLVDNDMSIPNDVLYAFTLNQASFGGIITPKNDLVYAKIKEGSYQYIDIVIYDQNFKEMIIKDPDMLFVLSIIRN